MLTKEQRELIVRLSQDGKKQQYIARLIDCSQAAVSKWLSRHKTGRTLETLPRRGRPTELTQARLKRLKQKLLQKIKKVNQKYCSLSTKQLAEIIKEEVGKSYSMRHVERIMHHLGFSLIKPRSKRLKHDQKKVDEFRDMFKKNFGRSIWVISS